MAVKLYLAGKIDNQMRNKRSSLICSSTNGQSLAQIKELDINTQTLYQLAQYIQVRHAMAKFNLVIKYLCS